MSCNVGDLYSHPLPPQPKAAGTISLWILFSVFWLLATNAAYATLEEGTELANKVTIHTQRLLSHPMSPQWLEFDDFQTLLDSKPELKEKLGLETETGHKHWQRHKRIIKALRDNRSYIQNNYSALSLSEKSDYLEKRKLAQDLVFDDDLLKTERYAEYGLVSLEDGWHLRKDSAKAFWQWFIQHLDSEPPLYLSLYNLLRETLSQPHALAPAIRFIVYEIESRVREECMQQGSQLDLSSLTTYPFPHMVLNQSLLGLGWTFEWAVALNQAFERTKNDLLMAKLRMVYPNPLEVYDFHSALIFLEQWGVLPASFSSDVNLMDINIFKGEYQKNHFILSQLPTLGPTVGLALLTLLSDPCRNVIVSRPMSVGKVLSALKDPLQTRLAYTLGYIKDGSGWMWRGARESIPFKSGDDIRYASYSASRIPSDVDLAYISPLAVDAFKTQMIELFQNPGLFGALSGAKPDLQTVIQKLTTTAFDYSSFVRTTQGHCPIPQWLSEEHRSVKQFYFNMKNLPHSTWVYIMRLTQDKEALKSYFEVFSPFSHWRTLSSSLQPASPVIRSRSKGTDSFVQPLPTISEPLLPTLPVAASHPKTQ
ncbi:hypothetical protein [Sansalvadorimonas verongulae]|uniref:hypothetical protein n=1 Tax=Sansalvadorimonas verongulae TaxID=2172824 RepID=UPI0012BC0996|nr:hypothetical protein [Sansalvadorimonas verongulae]MTI13697.1 hypothetical protein [Sansalvadorimonas verongulae]